MAVGLSGVTGVTVPFLVVVECRIVQELVPIPHRPLVERHALGRVTKLERATKTLVQVKFALKIFFVVFLRDSYLFVISLSHSNSLLRLMEVGLIEGIPENLCFVK